MSSKIETSEIWWIIFIDWLGYHRENCFALSDFKAWVSGFKNTEKYLKF